MRVLFVASEVVPFAKTGGLADVAGALPRALEGLGVEVVVMLPAYRAALEAGPSTMETGASVRVPVGSRGVECRIKASTLPGSGVPVYLLDQPAYFDRDGLYGENGRDYLDNCERFVFFQRAALEASRALGFRPDVIHCNDWQTGLIPAYLDEAYRRRPGSDFRGVGTLLTVHNLAYQGAFWHFDMPITGLDWSLFTMERLEAYGKLNFLKAGLVDADLVNTVSPSYAREIRTEALGRGLDGVLRARGPDLRGIVNGIDRRTWDPATDSHLPMTFDAATVAEGKAYNKACLQRRLGLEDRVEPALLAAIGRLDRQKGWDLLVEAADAILGLDVQLAVLGTGNPRYEEALDRLTRRYPGRVRAFFGFSDELAHQIEAAADIFVAPSLFEPCGLNQLYSMAYGTVPVVRATGGLADTVVDASAAALADGTATGVTFDEATPEALAAAVARAVDLRARPADWDRLIRRGMAADWSWNRSGRGYIALYEEIHRRHAARAAG